MEVENSYNYIYIYLKGNYYWRDPYLTSMIMGGRVYTVPGTHMTSSFEGQPLKTRPRFQSKQGSSKGSRYM